MIPISGSISSDNQLFEKIRSSAAFGVHVCLPCIIQRYNSDNRTVEAQPTIRERYVDENGSISYIQYPLLIDVPVVFPCSGGYSITFPVNVGDECLVIFSDLSIDNWWIKGNIQNPVEQRRHDLSDGIAIVGLKNKREANNDTDYKPNALQIRNKDNSVGIEIASSSGKIYSNGQSASFDLIIAHVNS